MNDELVSQEPIGNRPFNEQLDAQIAAASAEAFDNTFHKVARPMTSDQWNTAFRKGYLAAMERDLTVHEALAVQSDAHGVREGMMRAAEIAKNCRGEAKCSQHEDCHNSTVDYVVKQITSAADSLPQEDSRSLVKLLNDRGVPVISEPQQEAQQNAEGRCKHEFIHAPHVSDLPVCHKCGESESDDNEVLFALGMSMEHDDRHQAMALRTWMPRIRQWAAKAAQNAEERESVSILPEKGAPATSAPDAGQVVPVEPTEEMIDAPRQIILYAETQGRTLQGLREHLSYCGIDCTWFPGWALDDGHLTKAAMNDLLRELMDDSMVANVAAAKAAGIARVTASLPVEYLARIQQHLDTGGWIKCSERLPTERDANEVGEVLMLHKVHKVPVIRHWKMVAMFGSDPQDTSMADASWQPLPPLPRSE